MTTELIIPSRFRGPTHSGNGGWTSGALAGCVEHDCPDNAADAWPTIRVALRQPPPLDTPLVVGEQDGSTIASFGGAVVAHAEVVEAELPPVEPVSAEVAREASAAYPGHVSHPFPQCFVCGVDRDEGDGLRIFPGPVSGPGDPVRVAATWTPHRSLVEDWHAYVDDHALVSLASTWAALDCTGGWAGDLQERLMVLAGITCRVDTLPVIGEEHVVVGEARRTEGRKTFTASALFDSDGRVVAAAEHVWVAVDPARFP
ncbi:MAG: hypothetical protein ACRDOM_03890 [Nocardioides sp.]